MKGDDDEGFDPDSFVLENEAKIRSMIELQRGMVKADAKKVKDWADEKIDKVEDKFKGTVKALFDPEVQTHFMKMGIEFFMGMEALIKAMPFSDDFKDSIDRAKANGEEARKAACAANPSCKVKKKVQKIDVD